MTAGQGQAPRLTLWRLTWSHAMGVYWMACRACDPAAGDSWLRIYQTDEPCARYALSHARPPLRDSDTPDARHVATS
jgi:hypothetical protein